MSERRLILMRHAKSSWAREGLSDHQRPLNGRGRTSAPRMAHELSDRGWLPDQVISSTAQRTRETWSLMEPVLGSLPLATSDELYLAGLGAIQTHARGWSEDWSCVLVLGHNPGWSEAASRLTGTPIEMTTANCVLMTGSGESWAEALTAHWELSALLRPREPRKD